MTQKEKTETIAKEEEDRKVLSSAPPPLDSVVIWIILVCLWIYLLPSWEELDKDATVETFTHRIFSDLISVEMLAYVRLAFATIVAITTIHQTIIMESIDLATGYLPQSKLRAAVIQLKGIRTLAPFTCVCWVLQGLAFALAGYVSLNATSGTIPVGVLRAGLVLWEVTAPLSLLVSTVVRYLIWPMVIQGGNTESMTNPLSLLQHNLNVFASLCEFALFGGLPTRWSHFPFLALFGMAYILFMWCSCCSWVDVEKFGPQFIYFFADTTLPGILPTACLLGLLPAIMLFYALFAASENWLESLPGGLTTHVLFVVAVCSVVMRFRN